MMMLPRAIPLLTLLLLKAGYVLAAPVTVQVRNAAGQALADAVVAIEIKGLRPTAAAGTTAQMAQRDRAFQPGLLLVQAGTAVSFPNFDTVRHHVYSFSPVKTFEIKLYAGTPAAPVVFDKAGVAVLGCNIHDRMSATIVVLDTPHFARTDARGQASFDLPTGEHVLKAWHPAMGPESAMSVQALPLTGGGVAVQISLPVK